MRIVALLAIRNEALYMQHCLEHLISQGIAICVIDNESTDETRSIAERYVGRGVIRIETTPYAGFFDWAGLLQRKEKLAQELDADWFVHHDADEIREAPIGTGTLQEAIIEADAAGYNAVNFDEFVFLPTNDDESFENVDYKEKMKYYYFFEPLPSRQVKAWKNLGTPIDIKTMGGHQVRFEGIRVFPENFIMRHYIVLSRRHAIDKYCVQRVYSKQEVEERLWHGERARFKPEHLTFPARDKLQCFDGKSWIKSDPWRRHTFLGDI